MVCTMASTPYKAYAPTILMLEVVSFCGEIRTAA